MTFRPTLSFKQIQSGKKLEVHEDFQKPFNITDLHQLTPLINSPCNFSIPSVDLLVMHAQMRCMDRGVSTECCKNTWLAQSFHTTVRVVIPLLHVNPRVTFIHLYLGVLIAVKWTDTLSVVHYEARLAIIRMRWRPIFQTFDAQTVRPSACRHIADDHSNVCGHWRRLLWVYCTVGKVLRACHMFLHSYILWMQLINGQLWLIGHLAQSWRHGPIADGSIIGAPVIIPAKTSLLETPDVTCCRTIGYGNTTWPAGSKIIRLCGWSLRILVPWG